MTEEEKNAFLTTALNRVPKGNYSSGPPIRQAIPDVSEEPPPSKKTTKNKKSTTVKGLINTDPLWNAVMGKAQRDASAKGGKGGNASRGDGMSDDAKKKYLEMVTNPDRFSSYAAMGGVRKSTASAESVLSKGTAEETEEKTQNLPDEPTASASEPELQ